MPLPHPHPHPHRLTHCLSQWDAICHNHNKRFGGSLMGYSMRTREYRYNAWFHFSQEHASSDFSRSPVAEELYSHEHDNLGDIANERYV